MAFICSNSRSDDQHSKESLFSDSFFLFWLLAGICLSVGCSRSEPGQRSEAASQKQDPQNPVMDQSVAAIPKPGIVRWVKVPELPRDLAIMDSVFWEPDDTISLRTLIMNTGEMKDASVLEVGTGSGLVSLCCVQAGASSVVATDLNPAAVANARDNADTFGFADRLEVRQVPRRDPGAWTVIRPNETFDFIISNPPWEDQKPVTVEQFALYDPDFQLLDSLVQGARKRLKPNGRMWLAYGCVTAIRRIQEVAAKESLECRLLDERKLEELPEVFLPGMLIELTVPTSALP
jgi:release factor glutamine methyltransferase